VFKIRNISSLYLVLILLLASAVSGFSQAVVACYNVPDYTPVGKTITICQGATINLRGDNCSGTPTSVTYRWNNTTSSYSSVNFPRNFFTQDTGRWVLTVTDGSIVSRDTLNVRFFAKTAFSITNGDFTTKCQGSNINLSSTVSAFISDYRWYINEAVGAPIGINSTLTVSSVPESTADYIVTARDLNNCLLSDTIFVWEISKPPIELGADRTICSGQTTTLSSPSTTGGTFSYAWSTGATTSTINVTTAGKYWLRVTGPFPYPCSNSDTINVFVTPAPKLSVSATPAEICFGNSAQLNTTLTTAGTAPYIYKWTPAASLSNAGILNPVASQTATTTYKVHITDSGGTGGCKDSVNIQVVVNPKINVNMNFIDSTICRNSPVTLGAAVSGGTPGVSPTYTYAWKPTASLNDPFLINPVASPSVNTLYTLIATDSKACTDSAKTNIRISNFAVSISEGDDATICTGDSIRLTTAVSGGASGYTYTWSPAAQVSSVTSASVYGKPVVSNSVFAVIVKDGKGCELTDQIIVDLYDLPVSNAGLNDTVCLGSSANISGTLTSATSGPYVYRWTNNADDNILTGISHAVNHNATVDYFLEITDGRSCRSAKSPKKIVVLPNPFVPLTDVDTFQCTGLTVLLDALHANNNGYEFSWFDQDNTDLGNTTSIVVGDPGNYSVTIVNPVSGCESTVVKKVSFIETPGSVVVSSMEEVEVDEALELVAVATGLELVYTWSSSGQGTFDGMGDIVFYNPEIADTGYVEIFVQVENICGMVDTVHTIKVYKKPQAANDKIIYIPTAFSPKSTNPDNLTLKVFAPAISESNFTFEVFNRWGQLIYKTEEYSEAATTGWDGHNHAMGVYTYIVKGEFVDGEKFAKTGNATLVR
jgi:hypothetical protein